MFKFLIYVVAITTNPATPAPPTYTITHQVGGMKVGITADGKLVKVLASGGVIIGDMYYPPTK